MRHLFVISREHAWLYAYLRERFQDDSSVDVILDRRVSERRAAAVPTQFDRRNRDRRRAVSPDQDLRVHSHYIVEL